MTENSTRSGGVRRGARRIGALAAATGLLLVGVLMAGPAIAASAAEPAEPIVPITDQVAVEPISETIAELYRPLGLTIFLGSAVTLGAGAIVATRLIAHRSQAAPVRSSTVGDEEG